MKDSELRPPTLLALPSYLAGHVAHIGHRKLANALAEHDLRLPHFAVLTGLSDFGPLAQHDLADRLGLQRPHLVGYIDQIQRHGLAHRERDPDDRRRQRIALTPAGTRLVRHLTKVATASQDGLLVGLSEAERDTLTDLLRRVVTADDAAQSAVTT
jgi:DNA-binding MarR family transcriptional regulator